MALHSVENTQKVKKKKNRRKKKRMCFAVVEFVFRNNAEQLDTDAIDSAMDKRLRHSDNEDDKKAKT